MMRPVYPTGMPCMICEERPPGRSRWICDACGAGTTLSDLLYGPRGEQMTKALWFIAQVVLEEHGYLAEDLSVTAAGREWLKDPDGWGRDGVELLALTPIAVMDKAGKL